MKNTIIELKIYIRSKYKFFLGQSKKKKETNLKNKIESKQYLVSV